MDNDEHIDNDKLSRFRPTPGSHRGHESSSRRIYKRASGKTTRFFQRIAMTEHLFMIVLALIIGTLGGLGAVGVRALIREISAVFFAGEGTLLENMAATPWYLKLVIPALGGLIVGPIIYFFAPEAKGTGVPEVMQSVLVKGGRIRPRVAFLKTIVSTITIGTGGSVGREGPIVQIGASIGSLVGQFFQISSKRMKTLVGCGAAAGIAAAFNAPVAGALFAVEIILMDYAVAQFSPIVISSVMATVISHAFEGDFPAIMVIGDPSLQSFWEVDFYLVLGVLSGVVSYLFIKSVYSINDVWEKRIRMPEWLKATFGGLTIGVIALFFPQIMGVGYDSVNMALNEGTIPYLGLGAGFVGELLADQTFWVMALLLVFVKIVATSMTLGSGGSGGIFAPSLFIGAMLGAFFGYFVNLYFPDISATPGTYALIGMGGLVAGTTRAPITAIITIFELTKETSIILPLMLVCIIGTIVSSKFSRESIYTLKLLARNINVRNRAEVNVMKNLFVKDLYSRDFVSIPENKPFDDIVTTLISRELPYISVHDIKTGHFKGIITIHDIKDVVFEKDTLRWVIVAGDIADTKIQLVDLDENASTVLKKMKRTGYDCLPVVDVEDEHKQIGLIWLQDIVEAYDEEMEHIDITSGLADRIAMSNLENDIRFLEGYVISEVPAPSAFVGKSLRDLAIRSRYGVDVLSIKDLSKSSRVIEAIPQADYIIHPTDILVVAGKADNIAGLKNLE